VSVEVELGESLAEHRRDRVFEAMVAEALGDTEGTPVGDVMSPDPLVVAPEDTLGEVADRMYARDASSALVAEYGRLIGILTARDMLRAVAGRVHPSEARVRQWMTAEPIAVSPSTTVEAAKVLMLEHYVHHLAVVEGDRPVGMVGMRDVVRAAAPLETGIGLGF
jgi:CBS domain-containing protein